MLKQTPGKIFLADQRGVQQSAQFRRYSTFRFGACAAEHKEAFGPLHALNEETLAGQQRVAVAAAQASHVLVVPITGQVWVEAEPGVPALVDAEEMYWLPVPAGSTLHFRNPYESELISFLHIWLSAPASAETGTGRLFAFNPAAMTNQLAAARQVAAAPAAASLPFVLSLGRFAGRAETVYSLRRETSRFFAFVLAGAFEVAGRLLHEKDGLALWGTGAVELEALSNDAVVLVLEMED